MVGLGPSTEVAEQKAADIHETVYYASQQAAK